MAVGYVLVNVTPGMEIAAYNSIKSMENVDDITVLFGDYDLIVKLVADDLASIAKTVVETIRPCLLYTSPSPRDSGQSRMPSSA